MEEMPMEDNQEATPDSQQATVDSQVATEEL